MQQNLPLKSAGNRGTFVTKIFIGLFVLLLLNVQVGWGQTTYNLITSTAGLSAGSKYLIVSTQTNGSGVAAGYQNTNNRPQASITVASSAIAVTPATSNSQTTIPFEFTLGGSSGAWTLYDAVNSGYLKGTSSSNNYLQLTTPNGTWTISFSSNAAVMTCTNGGTNNILRYNSASSLFSCYASGQAAVYLYQAVASCTPPTTQATSLSVNTTATTSSNYSFTRGNGTGGVIVVARLATTTAVAPTSSTTYTPSTTGAFNGTITTGAGNIVIYNGTAAGVSAATGNLNITNLAAGTQYNLTSYEYNTTSTCYNTTSPPSNSFYTLSTSPTGNPASFTSSATDQNNIGLSFSAASTVGASGYLIIQKLGATASTFAPSNATAYTTASTISDGTIAAVITSTSATSSAIASLIANTQYTYTIIPYAYDGTNAVTYNYYTTTNKTTTTTTAALTVPGAPTIGTATAGNTSASIIFTAPSSTGGSAILDYTVTSSPGGLTATGASSPITITGLTNGTAYTFTVTARNAQGTSAASGPSGSVTPALTYCTPDNLDCSQNDYISNITINTLNNTTTCGTTTTGYTIYPATGTQTTTLTAGSSYNLTISSGAGTGTHGAAVWIDFNNNGVFTDAGEYFLISNSIAPSVTTSAISVAVPSGAFTGNVRMRIRYIYNTTVTSAMSCTSGGSFGETEDYTLLIAAPCTQPTTPAGTITANTTTSTTSNYSFTRGNGNAVIIVARLTSTSAVAPVSGTAYTPSATGSFTGTTITGTGNVVIYNGTAAGASTATGNLAISNLTAGTSYTLTAYEYNTASTCYNTTSPGTGSFYTLSAVPTANPASFTATASNQTSIALSFSAASTITNAYGYLIFQRQANAATTFVPSNATAYTVGTIYGDGTLAGNVTSTATIAATISSLAANTQYYYTIIPYGYNGTNAATYNYYTSTNLTATATTPAFTTPTLTTPTSANVINTTATLGGNITSLGGGTISASGIVWAVNSTNSNPALGGTGCTTVTGSATTTGAFTVSVAGLPAGTLISYVAYATNGTGTGYTTPTTFTTKTIATKLAFGTVPPTTGTVSSNLTSFTVLAQRVDGTTDVEYTGSITIVLASGTSNLAGTLTATAAAGIATFSAVQFSATGTYTINAAATGLTASPASSNIAISLAPLPVWTFENTANAAAGPYSPAIGSGSVTVFHASASTYTSGTGNGSANSYSSNTWTAGDYYQFLFSTAGYSNIGVSFDQTGSNTGPRDFQIQYSTNGSSFTTLSGSSYSLLVNGWVTGSSTTANSYSFDLSSITSLNNAANVYIRLVDASTVSINAGTVQSAGTNRVDNFAVKLKPTIIVTPGTYIYTAAAQGPDATVTNTGGSSSTPTFLYVGTGSTTYASSATKPTNAGTYSVTASVVADANYIAASSSPTAFTIGTAVLTITANNGSKSYGQTFTVGSGSTAFSSSGLLNSQTIGSITIASTGALNTTSVGTYPIVPSAAIGGTFTASNYTITYTNGTLTVGTAALTITANNGSKSYGQTFTVGSGSTAFTSSGLLNSETIGSITIASTGAVNTAAVGTYPIVASAATGGTFTASNYTITYTNGTLTIGTAALTITANNGSKSYGQTFTVGSGSTAFTSSGLLNSETIGSITIASTGAVNTAAVGTYTIVASAATGGTFTASNYTITYTNGTLTVGTASLTITGVTANNKIYDGTTTATLSSTPSYNGLQNGETFTVTGTAVANFNNATPGTNKPVTVTGYTAPSANYTVSQPAGLTATITPAAPTANNDGPVCVGSTLNLSTALVAGATYSWTGPNSFSSALQNPAINSVTTNAAGTYSLTITENGATSLAGTTTVVVNTVTNISAVAPSTQTVLANSTPANLTVTATGVSLSYQWFSNGTSSYSGSTNLSTGNGAQTAAYTPITTAAGTIYYYCQVSGTCGTVNSSIVSVTVTNLNTWVGGGSDWNTGSNWSAGVVPTGSNDAVIPAGNTPYPILSSATTITNLTIGAGAAVTIGSNTLTINGAVSSTGSITGGITSGLTIGGTAGSLHFTQTGTGNYLKDLTLNTGASATLGNLLNITAYDGTSSEGSVTVAGTATLTTAGFLTLKSSASGTARIGQGRTTGGYISGDVTVERYIQQNTYKGWRLLGSPTSGQSINAAWQEGQADSLSNTKPGYGVMISGPGSSLTDVHSRGLDARSPGASLFYYDPATDNLLGITNTLTTSLNTYPGYFLYVRGNRAPGQFGGNYSNAPSSSSTILRSTGALYTGNQASIPSVAAGKYGLVNNPFASRLDMRNITLGGGMVNTFQVWDPKLTGAFGYGAYQTFTKVGANYQVTPGLGSYGAINSTQNFLESGAAFFVQATGITGTIVIDETAKTSGSAVVNRPPGTLDDEEQRFITSLYAVNTSSTDLADGNLILLGAANTNAVDINDVRKSPNFGENFGIVRSNTDLVVERRALFTATDTIFFNMNGLKQQAYKLAFMPLAITSLDLNAFLEDGFLGTSTPVSMVGNTEYTFAINATAASSATNRFRIVFRQQPPLPVTVTSIRAYTQANNIGVEWKVENQLNITKYEIERSTDSRNFTKIGTQFATNSNSTSVTYNWLDVNTVSGNNYYRIKCVDANGVYKYTAVVHLLLGNVKPSIAIWPNPVEGNSMNVVFTNKEKGTYQIRLINTIGQVVFNRTTNYPGGNATQVFTLPDQLVRGVYQLELVAPNNERQVEKVIVN